MGILADVQPIWLYWDGPALEKVFGHEGMRYFIPLRTYRNSDIVLAGGSDHMIGFDKNKATNGYNPFLSMWIAVARRMSNGEVLFPEERLTRQEALEMYTSWPAYMQFNEKNRGSLERGKLADMVVIDRDYLTCAEDEIRNIQPVITILDGRVAYESGREAVIRSFCHNLPMTRRDLLQCMALTAAAPGLSVAGSSPLPGTQPLTWDDDLSERMMDGAHRYVQRKIAESLQNRKQFWHRDFSSRAAYEKSVEPNRAYFRHIIGAVDERVPVAMERFGDELNPALVAETDSYRVHQVFWPVFERVRGEGLLLEPKTPPRGYVVALPDADQTPEQLAGLAPGIEPVSQFARRLAENGFYGCRSRAGGSHVPVVRSSGHSHDGSDAS